MPKHPTDRAARRAAQRIVMPHMVGLHPKKIDGKKQQLRQQLEEEEANDEVQAALRGTYDLDGQSVLSD